MPPTKNSILILGAGINGAAIARELCLNGQSVTLVDTADMAFGATAYSSRLIHGGLRYLEYGEFDLVRESLAERTRLLRLAPQFVKPLRLFIPIENRFGGLWASASRFLFKGNRPARPGAAHTPRGLWLVRFGLRTYDVYARDPDLPKHATHRWGEAESLPVDRRYRWLCSYYDAQVRFPERFVLAMLADTQAAADANGATFEVLNYHRASLDGQKVSIYPTDSQQPVRSFEPTATINATGAWVDLTLSTLHLPSKRLMGGTKGSHLVSWNERLREALNGDGLYAEAPDGRPVFVLPFGDATLIGTTDLRYQGDPADAVATQDEIDYLVSTVNELMPEIRFTADDVHLHYSGVRPLPYVDSGSTASITRRHGLVENTDAPMPFYSVIGGKLTTCRSLAEEVTATVLARLKLPVVATSEDRLLPGAEDYPASASDLKHRCQALAERLGYTLEQILAAWELHGARTEIALTTFPATGVLAGLDLPLALARYAVRAEWARTLDDLVERRLMLLYHHRLGEEALRQLATVLVDEGVLSFAEAEAQIPICVKRLQTHFGKRVSAQSQG